MLPIHLTKICPVLLSGKILNYGNSELPVTDLLDFPWRVENKDSWSDDDAVSICSCEGR